MYKAIFIDIDGTLRNNKRKISERTIKSIKNMRNKNILIVLCSGRPAKHTQKVSMECNASNYVINSNGANIYDYEKKVTIYNNSMDKKAVIQLYEIAQKENVRLVMNSKENRFVNKLKYFDDSEKEIDEDINTFLEKNDVEQCVIMDESFEKIKRLKLEVKNIKNVEVKNQSKSLICQREPKTEITYIDIADIKSSKGNAIKKFCQILNIDLKNTIAIGDSHNDISMFEVVGYSVVMENASSEVKKYADEVTKSNEEDGAAVFLEKLYKSI